MQSIAKGYLMKGPFKKLLSNLDGQDFQVHLSEGCIAGEAISMFWVGTFLQK